jgi:hypothetical protein
MQKFTGLLLVVLGFCQCTPRMGKDIAHAVIDLALAACVAENPGRSEPELKGICHYADELAPVVHDLIGAQQRGSAKAAAAVCSPDAGTPREAGK